MKKTGTHAKSGLTSSKHHAAIESLERRRLLTAATIPLIRDPGIQLPADRITAQDIESNAQIGLNKLRADSRFSGIDGRGFATVIIDSAIDLDSPYFGPDSDHNGVSDRIVYSYDFTGSNDSDASGTDDHGSNVTSIVAGQSNRLYSGSGMAPGANIIFLKVFPDSGGGASSTDITEALQWTVDHVSQYNIASVNLSLGSGNYQSPVDFGNAKAAFAALAAKNVITVAAAGNSFYQYFSEEGVAWPAVDPNVLAVSAVLDADLGDLYWASGAIDYSTDVDRIISFSQRSTSLTDIYAPGGAITGASASGGSIVEYGTSQASPHIAGIAVLAQQLAVKTIGRRLTFTEYRNLLRTTAKTINDGDDEDDNVEHTFANVPRVDVYALGQAILAMGPTTPTKGSISGTVFNDSDGNGAKGGSESGVSGINVYSDSDNDSVFDSTEPHASTNSGGVFTIPNLSAGTYKIRQVLPANTKQTTPSGGLGISVNLATGQNATGYLFGEQKITAPSTSSVSGTVTGGKSGTTIYLDADDDSVLDSSEKRTTTASNGTYTLTGVTPGNYVVRQVLPSGYTQVTPASNRGIHVTVVSGKSITGQNFTDKASSTTKTTTLQAETAALAGGTAKSTRQTGYTGTGYADFGGSGSSAKFTFTAAKAGSTTLSIRYSNGSTTSLPFSVIVNGVTIGTFPGGKTGAWNAWATASLAATLKAGSNVIQLVAGSAGGANLDWLSYTTA